MRNPRAIIAGVASEYIGTREESRNRGPHLEEFWKATSYQDGAKNREPWCSAFATFCVREADRRSPELNLRVPPTFPAVAQWLPWAKRSDTGCLVFTPRDVSAGKYRPEAGDIVVFLPRLSHVGIVESFDGETVHTIEGNTNEAGSRDGDGVFLKRRDISFCGSFIRVPPVAQKA